MRKLLSLLAVVLIGDAVAGMLGPRRYLRIWSGPSAPDFIRQPTRVLRANPGVTRALAAAELAVGVAIMEGAASASP